MPCCTCACSPSPPTEIARHQLEQQRLGERLREQEERLKGLHTAQSGAGILPMYGQMPAPLFPPIGGDGMGSEVFIHIYILCVFQEFCTCDLIIMKVVFLIRAHHDSIVHCVSVPLYT